ncbi:MAG: hypothetical protein IT324_16435 [Anaerolineae bacterium]|nr:hypothetical protein [Anaerolineae bacterium]
MARIIFVKIILVLCLAVTHNVAAQSSLQDTQEQYFVFTDGARTYSTLLSTGKTIAIVDGGSAWQFTPDGQALVIHTEIGAFTIVPLAGGPTRTLKANVGNSAPYTISPNGTRIIFIGSDGLLYSVGFNGGSSVPLSVNGATISTYFITPDGNTVVYPASVQRRMKLFAVSTQGGSPIDLTGQTIVQFAQTSIQITPDSTRIVFAGKKRDDEKWGIFAVPSTGGSLTQLNTRDVLIEQGYVGSSCCVDTVNYVLTPDGSSVIFKGVDGATFRVGIAGGTEPVEQANTIIGVSPNRDKVLVRDSAGTLSVSPVTGGAPVKLDLPPNLIMAFTTDGQYIVAYDRKAIYSASTIDGKAQKISPDSIRRILASPGNTYVDLQLAISADSQRVVYFAEDIDGIELMSTPIAGGKSEMLNPVPGTVTSIFPPLLWTSADGAKVVFMLDQEQSGQRDLYLVPAKGGSQTRLTNKGELYRAGNSFRAAMGPKVTGKSTATGGTGDSSASTVATESAATQAAVGEQNKITLTIRRPTDKNEAQRYRWLLEGVPLEDSKTPATQRIEVQVAQSEPRILGMGWCAKTPSILTANLRKMAWRFLINDIEVPVNQFLTYSYSSGAGDCMTRGALISGWKVGEPYTIIIEQTLDAQLNDGSNTYAPGKYVTIVTVTAY